MRRTSWWMNAYVWTGLGLTVLAAAGWAWFERGPLLAWYYTRQLSSAALSERDRYLAKLVELEEDAVPALVGGLRSPDESACANCGWALGELARRWGAGRAQAERFAAEIGREFSAFSPHGRKHAIEALANLLAAARAPAPAVVELSAQAVRAVAASGDETARAAALQLAYQLLSVPESPSGRLEQLIPACQQLIASGIKDSRADCRAWAVRLAAVPAVERLELAATLLAPASLDPAPDVRRLAVAALGSRDDLLGTDDLLSLLHDTDAEVRIICEQALRSRGLAGAHLQLARLMSDPQPVVRARVPAEVLDFPDLDTRAWLVRLSRDQSPLVRAAVVSAAGEGRQVELRERMQEMARSDPSPTVKQIADYYVRQLDGER